MTCVWLNNFGDEWKEQQIRSRVLLNRTTDRNMLVCVCVLAMFIFRRICVFYVTFSLFNLFAIFFGIFIYFDDDDFSDRMNEEIKFIAQ